MVGSIWISAINKRHFLTIRMALTRNRRPREVTVPVPGSARVTFHLAEHLSVTFEEAVPILGARGNQKTEHAFNSKIPRAHKSQRSHVK